LDSTQSFLKRKNLRERESPQRHREWEISHKGTYTTKAETDQVIFHTHEI